MPRFITKEINRESLASIAKLRKGNADIKIESEIAKHISNMVAQDRNEIIRENILLQKEKMQNLP